VLGSVAVGREPQSDLELFFAEILIFFIDRAPATIHNWSQINYRIFFHFVSRQHPFGSRFEDTGDPTPWFEPLVAFCDNLLTDYLEDNIGKLGISAINLQ
jgi:hypothetical protein